MDVLSRTLITLAICFAGLAAFLLLSRVTLLRARNKTLGLEAARPGLPTILYFTTPTCVPCRTVQGPAIESVAKAHGGDMQVIKIDAQERPEVADHWGVLSVPTTFILDRGGQPRFLNAGVTRAEKLERQLTEAGL
ncbi:MAG: thioredoxin family protein [Chloroflexi bacterium]|nr:thioredoxin family protein [Chloroflexota bacterium]